MKIPLFDDAHRLACRRQHRVFGQYLALQSWVRGLDCIVVERRDLEHYLGLERLKGARIEWLKDDLLPWFPYQQDYQMGGRSNSIHSLFLARVPVATFLSEESLTTEDRITAMPAGSPKTGLLVPSNRFWPPPTEKEIIAQLAVQASGLAVPQDYPLLDRVMALGK